MKLSVRIQLSLMMFMQFCAWGAWYGQMSKYMSLGLQATGDQVGQAYAGFSIAMIAAPFFVGVIADRLCSAQKVLGVLNLTGAAILYWLTQVKDPNLFIGVMLLYAFTFAPTLALTSSISMRQMADPEKEFPSVRMVGTIAWVFIVNAIGWLGVGGAVMIFQMTLWFSVALGIFAFFLPDTPPSAKEPLSIGQILGKDALALFRDRSYLIFFISSILVCIPLAFYFTWTNPSLTDAYVLASPGADPTGFRIENKMSLGQVSEVLFMLILPFFYKRWGIKRILVIALVAWVVRFLFFGIGNPGNLEWMFYVAILLHGICYDFFFVSGMIYTDSKAGAKIKSQAQGLISLATYGVGMLFGSLIAGWVKDFYTGPAKTDWLGVWIVPATISVGVLVFVLIFFKGKNRNVSESNRVGELENNKLESEMAL